jgi:hypothetical protein
MRLEQQATQSTCPRLQLQSELNPTFRESNKFQRRLPEQNIRIHSNLTKHKTPNAVYTSQWPDPAACGSSLKVLSNGTLSGVLETWKYSNKSRVQGLAFGAQGKNLHSADLSGDGGWTHEMGSDGEVPAVATLPM